MKTRVTVVVLFDVIVKDNYDAEQIVEERLKKAKILWENDSNDAVNDTLDPIVTYVVVPARDLLADSI